MYAERLKFLGQRNLLRTLRDRESPQGARVTFKGRDYVNFASNDYLGLANHPYVIRKAKEAVESYGFGAGASRLLGGGSVLHGRLEDRIARFKGVESSLILNSGYAANTGVLPALAGNGAVLFSDELNHASLIVGCRLSGSKTLVYKHRDMPLLEELLRKEAAEKKIVITDTVFSMDGDIAPLKELTLICRKYAAVLYLDDAHATGVIGRGRGSLVHFGLKPEPWIIQMGTFSKALGSYGAFLAGSSDVVKWTINSARSFMFSTALPSCAIAASMAALELIETESSLVDKLWMNRNKLAQGIERIGLDITGSETPIIPLKKETIEDAVRLSARLFESGIYAPAIRPPTVKEPRVRITVTAAHTDEDIERLIEALKRVGQSK